MGYLHIDNLYKDQTILAFKHIYALEKIHGTSADIKWSMDRVMLHSGVEKHERFAALFDLEALKLRFQTKFGAEPGLEVTIYGEAYGGKQQGMSQTYGKDLKFVAFDVQIGDQWLSVPKAAAFVAEMGLEFVSFNLITTSLEEIDGQRDLPSVQARLNGIDDERIREGVVLRPPFECILNNGNRVIAKHKRAEFSERGTPKLETLDPTRRVILEQAEAIAQEWVTPMRLEHVLDKVKADLTNGEEPDIKFIPAITSRMFDDIFREAEGEAINIVPAKKEISRRTVKLFKAKLEGQLKEAANG